MSLKAALEPTRIAWKSIEPLTEVDDITNGGLASLDALRQEWARRLRDLPEEERVAVRQRSLRRLSIETGILERLYEVDWGLTLTLVAQGFTRDVVERAGGRVDERTLATLRAQTDSLALVLDVVRQERQLTSGFIRELHHAITRTQDAYVVTDTLGRVTETRLDKGQWKTQPNHVLRGDNTLLEYTPPEHVQSEIDRLVQYWIDLDTTATHPIVKAALEVALRCVASWGRPRARYHGGHYFCRHRDRASPRPGGRGRVYVKRASENNGRRISLRSHTEEMHDINRRAPELERLLEDGLSVALAEMMKKL